MQKKMKEYKVAEVTAGVQHDVCQLTDRYDIIQEIV